MVRAARADSNTHLGHHPQAMPGHHRRFAVDQTMAALGVSPGHSSPAARAQSCLTRAGHRPVVWPHEIPDSGISHRSTGSSPRSGTEAGDISPVSVALEHAAGDFTALGTDHSLEGSSPPSDTFSNFFCKKPFAGARTLQGYALVFRSIQRYSYRYRYRVLMGQGRCRPPLTPAH